MSSDITIKAHPASLILEELAAVTVPSFLIKAGLTLDILSFLNLLYSSSSTTVSFSDNLIGTIWSFNLPSLVAYVVLS